MAVAKGFTESSVKRIAAAVRTVEATAQPNKRGSTRPGIPTNNLPRLGKANADIAIDTGAANNVSLWSGTPGSESDTTIDFTAWNKFGAIDSGAWVWCEHNGYGWYITQAVCPA
jgi:hypothetical protein